MIMIYAVITYQNIIKMKILTFTIVFFLLFTSSIVAQVPAYLPSNGLIGWWPFNGNANDESGNGLNGTVYSAVLTNDRFGYPNAAYSFDGVNDYIVTNRVGLNSFSFSAWYYLDINTHYSPIIDAYNANWEFLVEYLNPTFVRWVTSPTVYVELFSNATTTISNWHHLACTYNQGTVKIYHDGVLAQTFNNVTFPVNNGNYYFGRSASGTSQYLDGKLDDIGMWDRPLTPEEIDLIYNGCSVSVVSQPQNAVNYAGLSTYFTTISSTSNSTYQWQTLQNNVFVDLFDVGQYHGSQNDTLFIYFLSLLNDGQQFRCVISSGNCSDTTNVVTLNVKESSGFGENNLNYVYDIYPNPTNSSFNISSKIFDPTKNLELYNMVGELIKVTKWEEKNQSLNIENLPAGVYFFRISGQNSFKKIIKH